MTAAKDKWTPVAMSTLPPDGTRVEWISPGGEVCRGSKGPRNYWFFEDGTYPYYTPTYWRERKV